MSDKVFLDCLGREINVGDVLANGHRDGDRGGITIGVVTGFTDDAILAKKLQYGHWHTYSTGKHCWSTWGNNDTWRFVKGRWTYGKRCFITGMTESDLRQLVVVEENEVNQ